MAPVYIVKEERREKPNSVQNDLFGRWDFGDGLDVAFNDSKYYIFFNNVP